jgi:DNA-binding transcriptional ArsR family regulator
LEVSQVKAQSATEAKALYAKHSEILKVLAGDLRHELIHHLVGGDHTVSELAEMSDASMSSVSQNLSVLKAHGLVEGSKDGREVTFHLTYPQLAQACALIDEILIDQAQRTLGLQSA